MIQTSMFPDLVPDEDLQPRVTTPSWVVQDGTWVLLRSTGRTINDIPRWHRIRARLSDGSTLALCGHHGSNVLNDVQSGAMIGACTGCLGAAEV